jgi:ABC-type Fe3+ transport system permease subunit
VKISTSGFSITISCILGRFMAILMVNQALKFEHFLCILWILAFLTNKR